MKFLFDFFPAIIFFVAYKVSGVYPETALALVNQYLGALVSDGAVTKAQAPMIVAIALGTIATAAQVAYLLVRGKEVVFMLWMALFGFVFFGGLTIYFHDDTFLKWKPTIIYWVLAAALLVGQMFFDKNFIRKAMEKQIALPDPVWTKLNLAWAAFFVVIGIINLFVAFVMFKGDTSAWVSFKVFGITGIMFVFIIGQTLMLTKYMKEDDA